MPQGSEYGITGAHRFDSPGFGRRRTRPSWSIHEALEHDRGVRNTLGIRPGTDRRNGCRWGREDTWYGEGTSTCPRSFIVVVPFLGDHPLFASFIVAHVTSHMQSLRVVRIRPGMEVTGVKGNQIFATCSSNQTQSSLPSSGSLLRGLPIRAHGRRYYIVQNELVRRRDGTYAHRAIEICGVR